MSNAAGAKTTREEEIAFLAMEQVLGVDIKLADAGAGDKMPDGSWVYPDGQERHGIVEVTSPPAASLIARWARAKKSGLPQTESGSIPLRLNELAQVCDEMLAAEWARENIHKLLAQPADERHLFLFGRRHQEEHYFFRLSDLDDDGKPEPVDDLVLPQGISDVWFRGRAQLDPDQFLKCSMRRPSSPALRSMYVTVQGHTLAPHRHRTTRCRRRRSKLTPFDPADHRACELRVPRRTCGLWTGLTDVVRFGTRTARFAA